MRITALKPYLELYLFSFLVGPEYGPEERPQRGRVLLATGQHLRELSPLPAHPTGSALRRLFGMFPSYYSCYNSLIKVPMKDSWSKGEQPKKPQNLLLRDKAARTPQGLGFRV